MKLSIITINHNNLEGLKRTANSVLSQTWTEFEWIIVDGNSDDGSKDYIEDIAAKLQVFGTESNSKPWHVDNFSMLDFTAERWTQEHGKSWIDDEKPIPPSDKRRLLWCSEPDKGIYNAMNKGIVKARGEYCLFLNSGDWLESPFVLKDFFDKVIVEDIVWGKLQKKVDRENRLVHTGAYKPALNTIGLMRCTIPHQSCFIRRILFEKVGFYDESLKIVADWKFFVLSISYWGVTHRFVDVLVSNMEPGGISDEGRFVEERKQVFDALFLPGIKEDILLAHSTRLIRKNDILRIIYSLMIRIANKLYE